MSSTEWISPTSASNQDTGGDAWSNPTNIYSSNNSRASVTINSGASDYLLAAFGTGISDAVPSDSTINGIEIRVEGYRSSNSELTTSAYLYDTGLAATFSTAESINLPYGASTSEAYATGGGATDTLGVTRDGGLTRAHLVASTFRLALQAPAVRSQVTYVDHVQIKVYYTYTPPEPEADSDNSVLFWSAP